MRNVFALLGGNHVGALTRTRASEWWRFYLNLRLVGLFLYLWHAVLSVSPPTPRAETLTVGTSPRGTDLNRAMSVFK